MPAYQRGIYFDGSKKMTLRDGTTNSGFILNTSFTLEFYIRPDAPNRGNLLEIVSNTDTIHLSFKETPVFSYFSGIAIESNVGADYDTWQHFAIIVNDT